MLVFVKTTGLEREMVPLDVMMPDFKFRFPVPVVVKVLNAVGLPIVTLLVIGLALELIVSPPLPVTVLPTAKVMAEGEPMVPPVV